MSGKPRRFRTGLTVVLGPLVAGLVLGKVWFRPARLDGLVIESAALLAPGVPDGSSKPVALATPVRIAIDFSVPDDLAALRERHDLPFIGAVLSACASPEQRNFEVLVQRAEYFGAYGRVRFLVKRAGKDGGRFVYRAVFDDRLTDRIDGRIRDRPARGVAGGLCFGLEGGSRRTGLVTDTLALPSVELPAQTERG